MTTTNLSDFKDKVQEYVDQVLSEDQPVFIEREDRTVVLLSLEEYLSLRKSATPPHILQEEMESGEAPAAGRLTVESFSEEEYASVMALMEANRGKDSEPKVGIFWYNKARNELYGVVSHRVSDYSRANASEGRITCSEMHEDIWKREFRKQKYRGDGKGPYVGAYQDKPRGRIFYNIKEDHYEVAAGRWIEECPSAYRLILQEFNLPEEKTSLKYAIHWDIGMSWR